MWSESQAYLCRKNYCFFWFNAESDSVKSHCLIFMVAQESNEHCSESLRYSKAIECGCPDNIRYAEKIFSQNSGWNHIVQANGYDEHVHACYCITACPSILIMHLIALVVELSTESLVCITCHLDVMSECNLLRTGRQYPEYVSWCSPKYHWVIQQWAEREFLDDCVALKRVMFVASDGQPGCPLTNKNNELPYFSRPYMHQYFRRKISKKNILCTFGAQIYKSIPNKMAVQYLGPTGHRIPENLIIAMTFISIIMMMLMNNN